MLLVLYLRNLCVIHGHKYFSYVFFYHPLFWRIFSMDVEFWIKMFFSFSFSYSILKMFYNVIAVIVSGKRSITLYCFSPVSSLGPHLPVQHLEKCPHIVSQIEKWFTPSVFLLLSIKVLSYLLFNAWTHATNNLPNVIVLQRASLVVQMVENPPAMQGFPGSSAGKESACNAGDLSLIPGLGRSPGEGTGYPL